MLFLGGGLRNCLTVMTTGCMIFLMANYTAPTITPEMLEGREAVCSQCLRRRPSSDYFKGTLFLFTYRGPGSKYVFETDDFYDGCRGWD